MLSRSFTSLARQGQAGSVLHRKCDALQGEANNDAQDGGDGTGGPVFAKQHRDRPLIPHRCHLTIRIIPFRIRLAPDDQNDGEDDEEDAED